MKTPMNNMVLETLLSFVKVTDNSLRPIALSLSKGWMPSFLALSWFDAPKEIPLGDKLTTNGR